MAHVIFVSAQVLLVLTLGLGLWTLDLGLTIIFNIVNTSKCVGEPGITQLTNIDAIFGRLAWIEYFEGTSAI